jgi:hypothetical protein
MPLLHKSSSSTSRSTPAARAARRALLMAASVASLLPKVPSPSPPPPTPGTASPSSSPVLLPPFPLRPPSSTDMSSLSPPPRAPASTQPSPTPLSAPPAPREPSPSSAPRDASRPLPNKLPTCVTYSDYISPSRPPARSLSDYRLRSVTLSVTINQARRETRCQPASHTHATQRRTCGMRKVPQRLTTGDATPLSPTP